MAKKILIISGHPSKESFTHDISNEYLRGAKNSGADAKIIYLHDLKFNPSLENGYHKIQKLENDLIEVQKKITWAEHIVFVYPVWWGGEPAKFKGLIDRVFLPGFAFKFEKKSLLPKQLLKGKSGRIFLIKGGSWLFYFGALVSPGMIMRRFVMNFCGIFPVRVKSFYSMNNVDGKKAKRILNKVYRLGKRESN